MTSSKLLQFSTFIITCLCFSSATPIKRNKSLLFTNGDTHAWINACGNVAHGVLPGKHSSTKRLDLLQDKITTVLELLNVVQPNMDRWMKYEDRFNFLPRGDTMESVEHPYIHFYKNLQVFVAAFEYLKKVQKSNEWKDEIEELDNYLYRTVSIMCFIEYEYGIDFTLHVYNREDMNEKMARYLYENMYPNALTNNLLNVGFTKKKLLDYLVKMSEYVDNQISLREQTA